VTPGWLAARLAEPAARAGVALAAPELAALARYATLLLSWAPRINLTGAQDPESLADHHLADALFLVPHLPRGARVLDVGAGAGLPGLVLAILRADLRLTMLEPSAKRFAFLRAALRELRLPHAEARQQSAQVHVEDAGFQPYDVAVSRATWPLPEWLERGRALIRPGGLVLGLEGREPAELPSGATRRPYELAGRSRAVILWKPGPSDPPEGADP
jgi:16S rRNA (guanine527-N7)-methyltransferase